MTETKRKLSEMLDMYGLPEETYTMQREVKKQGLLRYDITIIPAMIINNHYNKTKGHIHSSGHQEIYTVLEGTAIFIMQKMDKDKVEYVWAVRANKGESIIIPGDCYHVTINPHPTETLKMGNWVSSVCVSDYTLFEERKGACWYYTLRGFVPNANYEKVLLDVKQSLKEEPSLDLLL